MINKLIIWLQLFAALLLLSDAYLSETRHRKLNEKFKSIVGEFSEKYRQRYLKRDLVFFGLLIGSWILFWLFGEAGHLVGAWASSLGFWGFLLIAIWALTVMFVFTTALTAFTDHLDKHLNLLIKFPLCFALYKAPKGPIYTLGFALLVVSHVIQLFIEYGRPT